MTLSSMTLNRLAKVVYREDNPASLTHFKIHYGFLCNIAYIHGLLLCQRDKS